MSDVDVIVIGAGINGLVAGATLARRGRKVCILEQRADVGGMATLSENGGPSLAHLLYNLSPRALKEIGVDPKALPFDADLLPSVSLCPSGRHVVLQGGRVRFADGTAHPDAGAAEALIGRLTDYGAVLRHLAEGAPPGGEAPLSAAGLKALWRYAGAARGARRLGKAGLRRFLQVMLSNAYDLILDEMADGPLAGLLAADAVRGAAAGPRGPGTVFNLIYRYGHGGQVTLPRGGMGQAIGVIAAAARAAGCRIETGKRVRAIKMTGDRVSGVMLSDGSRMSCGAVLMSGGPASAIALTGPTHHDIECVRAVRNIRARGTAAKLNLKLSGPLEVPGLSPELARARLVLAPSADHVEAAFNPSKYAEMSAAPVMEAVQTDHAGATWLSVIVQYAPSDLSGGWTKDARSRLTNTALDLLAGAIPSLRDAITETQLLTPDVIESATGAPGGHWHHAEMALDQLLTLRPAPGLSRYAMGPKGLHLCGASSHPGGDVMGLAGRNAALALLEGGA